MAPGYEVNARLAAEAERRGDALAAMVRWGLAAEAARDDTARVGALAAAHRAAELALHQAAYIATTGNRLRTPWRELAAAAGVPFQTFHRRYHDRPARMPPAGT